jgi:hypothetical protein
MPSPINVAALPKWIVGDVSGLPPTATKERTSWDVSNVPTADSAYLEFTSGKDHASAIIAHVVPSPAHSRRALLLGGRKWFTWDGSRVGLHALRSKLPDQIQKAVRGQDLNPVARWRFGIYTDPESRSDCSKLGEVTIGSKCEIVAPLLRA